MKLREEKQKKKVQKDEEQLRLRKIKEVMEKFQDDLELYGVNEATKPRNQLLCQDVIRHNIILNKTLDQLVELELGKEIEKRRKLCALYMNERENEKNRKIAKKEYRDLVLRYAQSYQ